MDKREIIVNMSDVLLGETISLGNFEHAKLIATITGSGIDVEDQHWRFMEADDGKAWTPITEAFPIVNGVTIIDLTNFKRDLMMYRNPIGGATMGTFKIQIETDF